MRKNKLIFLLAAAGLLCVIPLSGVYALDLEKMKACLLNADYQAGIKEGERLLSYARSNEPNLDELYYLLGLSYLKQGNYLRASDIFEIIIREFRDSRFREASHIGLGDAYFVKGDYLKAEGIYSGLLASAERTKYKAGLYYRLSQIAGKLGNPLQEKAYLEKLKAEFPHSPECLGKVDVTSLPKPMKTEVAVPAANDKGFTYTVQVGAFSTRANALRLAADLRRKGYSAYIEDSVSRNKDIYKVKVGKLPSRPQAKDLERRLILEGYPTKIHP
ncbi:MAG: SPOR domain-containing protein [Candidatus Omnitrophica bacterium]|jgi:tetratricopeptide (TPR) repeat protein|nr:SPOR domain-containing protein [Candidatus Omnitrophota bacterium]MDD5080325.1 SPOR domain-containing protein [Candidatus Omnitrophota bacterium]